MELLSSYLVSELLFHKEKKESAMLRVGSVEPFMLVQLSHGSIGVYEDICTDKMQIVRLKSP